MKNKINIALHKVAKTIIETLDDDTYVEYDSKDKEYMRDIIDDAKRIKNERSFGRSLLLGSLVGTGAAALATSRTLLDNDLDWEDRAVIAAAVGLPSAAVFTTADYLSQDMTMDEALEEAMARRYAKDLRTPVDKNRKNKVSIR